MAVWDLSVTVEDLGLDAPPVTISVTSDLHIGGVILKLVEKTRGSPYLHSFLILETFLNLLYLQSSEPVIVQNLTQESQ